MGILLAIMSPLADGKCNEYTDLDAVQSETAHEQIIFFIHQNKDYVWLCHTVPTEGSPTWDDLIIRSPAFPNGLNLHASAQLGQWPSDQPEAKPSGPKSELWWNVEGWWATISHANYNEFRGEGREFQISKEHFGRGDWFVEAHIGGAGENGEPMIHNMAFKAQ